ncbi:MAG TPA: AbgT family transporter [Candidatus Lachnoclostridium pullistercoris]|uniref:AbgT family transporter n=1 Tax=Candidatus Lachnoclostridium pullistercoris TaxID=2838632 RepID=A0A9D2T4K1_9FIRM|nr:AbgT family transporter [Candidatus Lachnoclostridium pullistercoris]
MKEKKKFKMPHLLWIMFGIILLSCLATYVIPAGQFAVDEAGEIIGTEFHYLGYQTPVSPWDALMSLKSGLNGAATIMFVVMVSGATINVVLDTGVLDDLMNWAVYKLKDKGPGLLVALMMILMAYLGGFGGTDALIAVVPVGILFAKKLKLDPICALGVTTFAALVGFGTGPAQQATTQMLMDVIPYSAFFTRLVIMNFFLAAAIIMVLAYVKKIRKNPEASLMYAQGWRPETQTAGEEEQLLKKVEMNWRKIAVIFIFILQYLIIAMYPLMGGNSDLTFDFMIAVMICTMILVGIIGGMSADELGQSFAKGLASMAFVAFVIGLAKVISLVLEDGNVIHTIVYVLTKPLMDLPRSVASVGLTLIVSVINPIIPSATSKAAILVPIMKPVADALGLQPNLAVVAYQMGDSFTNLISPLLGWMIGSCAMADVPYATWLKWVFPKVLLLIFFACVIVFLLIVTGWSGVI